MAEDDKVIPFPGEERRLSGRLLLQLERAGENREIPIGVKAIEGLFGIAQEPANGCMTFFAKTFKENEHFARENIRKLRVFIEERSTLDLLELLRDSFGLTGPDAIVAADHFRSMREPQSKDS